MTATVDATAPAPVQRVSTLELFFDLVFVFTVTQLTAVLSHDLSWTALGQVITGHRSFRETVSGPISIAEMSKQAAEQGFWTAARFSSMISLNLGIFNLLPIPVLDGGLIFMLLLEAVLGIFGLPLTLRLKEKMMQVGFVMLLLLTAFVCFSDISKSVSRGRAPQQQQQQQGPEQKPPEVP